MFMLMAGGSIWQAIVGQSVLFIAVSVVNGASYVTYVEMLRRRSATAAWPWVTTHQHGSRWHGPVHRDGLIESPGTTSRRRSTSCSVRCSRSARSSSSRRPRASSSASTSSSPRACRWRHRQGPFVTRGERVSLIDKQEITRSSTATRGRWTARTSIASPTATSPTRSTTRRLHRHRGGTHRGHEEPARHHRLVAALRHQRAHRSRRRHGGRRVVLPVLPAAGARRRGWPAVPGTSSAATSTGSSGATGSGASRTASSCSTSP